MNLSSDEESSKSSSTDEESSGNSPTFEEYKEFLRWRKERKAQKEEEKEKDPDELTQKKPLSVEKQQLQVKEARAQIRKNVKEVIKLMSNSYSDTEMREMIERSIDSLPFFENDSFKRNKVKQVYRETLADLLREHKQEADKTVLKKKTKQQEENDNAIIEQLKATNWNFQNIRNYFTLLAQCKNKEEVINMPLQGGYTILHIASMCGNLSVIERLVEECGADLTVQDVHWGKSALHIASSNGHIAVIRYLASKVTDINQQDNEGNTALHHALHPANKNQTASVRILLDSGSDHTITNSRGKTPLQTLNKVWRHTEYYQLLEKTSGVNIRNSEAKYNQKQEVESSSPVGQAEYHIPSIKKKKGTQTAKHIASAVGTLISQGIPIVNQLIQGSGGYPINSHISAGLEGFGHMLNSFGK